MEGTVWGQAMERVEGQGWERIRGRGMGMGMGDGGIGLRDGSWRQRVGKVPWQCHQSRSKKQLVGNRNI